MHEPLILYIYNTVEDISKTIALTFQFHSNTQTFLESAVRTSFSLCFVNLAILIFYTCVPFVILDCSLKEPLCDRHKNQSVLLEHVFHSACYGNHCKIIFRCHSNTYKVTQFILNQSAERRKPPDSRGGFLVLVLSFIDLVRL